MKKLVLALTAIAAFTGSALAADLPARTYTKAPMMPEPVMNWTGFYIFGGAGGGVWDASSIVNTNGLPVTVGQTTGGDGWFGTVGAGYDMQFGGAWVAGILADGQFGSLKGSINGGSLVGPTTGPEKLRDTWAVGGRIGYLVAPTVLSYVNAGYTQSYWSGSTLTNIASGVASVTTPSFNKGGWFVGGGVENKLALFSFLGPNWFMKTEYRAAYFDSSNLVISSLATGLPSTSAVNFKPLVQTISTSLVYRFNWDGAVVARY
jgi:outer membrane immunogenic protein